MTSVRLHQRLRRGARALLAPVPRGGLAAEATGLRVALGGRTLLDGVGIEVRAGEVLTLVGPNGAGKSTLLAALAADLAPSAGEVRIGGRPAGQWPAGELALRRAVLPQAAAVAEAMAATEVGEFAARPFSALSGGERARVALARVLAQRTGLMLLDEPTAALDLRHQELVLRVCRERAAGDAVVVVLHDLGLAAAYADRVAVLHEGRVAADGPPSEVCGAELPSRVHRQPVEVFPHPRTGVPLVVPIHPRKRDESRRLTLS